MLLEICIDDPAGYEAALEGGADRIELCSALALGGLSPLPGLIELARRAPVPVMAMVRPRAGNFVWSAREVEQMLHEIDVFRAAGFAGVVLGANRPDHTLDAEVLSQLVGRAKGLHTTLHRAFDVVPDLSEAIETAVALGFDRILTSGRAPDVLLGLDDIRQAHHLAAGRLKILGGGGVNSENIRTFLAAGVVDEVHASGSRRLPEPSGPLATLGFEYPGRKITCAKTVAKLKSVAKEF